MVKEVNNQNLSYKLGLNEFSDTTWQEYAIITGAMVIAPEGSVVSESEQDRADDEEEQILTNNPDKVDWGAKRRIAYPRKLLCTNVRSVITAMVLESIASIRDNRFPTRRSSQQIIDCQSGVRDRCNSVSQGYIRNYFLYASNIGVTKEDNYPRETSPHTTAPAKNSESRILLKQQVIRT
jgi:hypothetical protein